MTKVYIIYRTFFDLKGEKVTVGGIQTYIKLLLDVFESKGVVPVVVQFADYDFQTKHKDVDVYGVDTSIKSNERAKSKLLLNFIQKRFQEEDYIVFATEDLFVPSFTERVLAIQHGVSWDRPRENNKGFLMGLIRRSLSSYRRLIRSKELKRMVCVDYNYVNWLRTQMLTVDKEIIVIPNSTKINEDIIVKDKEKIKIMFARRFEIHRGTRLFASVIMEILKKHSNIHVTFAGTGSDERYLKEQFQGNTKVDFITYKSEDSLDIHEDYHIAVVPTLGSEGTSLSLLEAMASKCAVVSTNVGGLTNIILDNYNGLMINPEEKELYESLERLITDKETRERLAENAYTTATESFNDQLWKKRWIKVIDDMFNK